ncbi:MAG TPA: AAA family ATPase [Terrimesophilobacter sp.]|nr:AAA family ATPase [Terrimesophilobacter sp.]
MSQSEPSRSSAHFELVSSVEMALAEFLFDHSGGPAEHTFVRVGMIADDGIARAGDGMEFDARDTDVVAVVFRDDQIDPSTITADYWIGIRAGRRYGVFLTWFESPSAMHLSAVGAEISCDESGVLHLGEVLSGEDAIAYMRRVELILEEDLERPPETLQEGSRQFEALSVSGYRGFGEKRTLCLAQSKGTPGSGLTVIVGANNSGKSTFIEAIHYAARARQQRELNFPQPRRHHSADAVSIELTRRDGRRLLIETVRAGGSQAIGRWLPEDARPDKFDIHVTPSRRSFNPYFSNSGSADRDWGLREQEFSRTQLRDSFVGRLRKVDRDPEARKVFDGLLERIVGRPLKWTIDEIATNQEFIKLVEKNSWHTSEGLGDGLVSLLFIVDALYDSEPGSLLAIDEPELSLHPQLIRRLRRVLSEFAANRQIVIATHSPLLLDWTDIVNGATVARVYKIEDQSEIAQASDESLRVVAQLDESRNPSNPHTVGAIAREAFFLEDGVILLEGQDDVVHLPRVLADLGLRSEDNLFGWGSGGASNTPGIAQLLRDLGFSRIAVILDDDGREESEKAFTRLEAMGPEVLVRRIPAPDIRFKKAREAMPEVSGLLDRDRTRVRPELRDTAREVLMEVLAHVTRGLR